MRGGAGPEIRQIQGVCDAYSHLVHLWEYAAMATDPLAKLIRAEMLVQGDGRPFSLALQKPQAIIRSRWLLPLVEPLQLDGKVALRLTRDLVHILGGYLGSILLAERKATHAQSLANLQRIAIESVRLAQRLEQLQNEYLVAIEESRCDDTETNVPLPFDFYHLVPRLQLLGRSAARVKAALAPNPTGATQKRHLDKTVKQLLACIGRAGLPITLINSGSATDRRRRVEGAGGELLIALFARFDASIDEATLWGAATRVQPK